MTTKAKKGWLVFVVLYVAYMSLYFVRYNFSVTSALLESGGILNKAQIGFIGSVFALVYAIVKIPAGFLGDRLPTRVMICTGLMLTAISNLLIPRMMAFVPIAILWGVNSAGQALMWGPVLRALHEHYGKDGSRKLQQYFITCTSVGMIVGLLAATYLSQRWSVTSCFLLAGLIPLCIAFAAFGSIRQRNAVVDAGAKQSVLQSVIFLWKSPEFRTNIFPAVTNGLIKDNVNVWLVIYFMDQFGADLKSVSGFMLFVPVMIFIGKIIFPPLNRLLGSEVRVSIVCFAAAVVALIPLVLGTVTPVIAMICLGVTSAMTSAINTHLLIPPADYAKSGNIALCASLMDTLVYGGAGIGSLFFGLMIAQWGYGSMFFTWAAASLISLFIYIAAETKKSK